ncbi:MAG TPA: hypothetical protein VHG34_02195, partial [Nitrososphaeraceae archaeon]|nr:hypothetical protein [Nitrososphaeraceae archaeon]
NKKAKLIEIISADTREIGTSAKRKKALGSEDMNNRTELEEQNLDRSNGHISDNQSITIDIESS